MITNFVSYKLYMLPCGRWRWHTYNSLTKLTFSLTVVQSRLQMVMRWTWWPVLFPKSFSMRCFLDQRDIFILNVVCILDTLYDFIDCFRRWHVLMMRANCGFWKISHETVCVGHLSLFWCTTLSVKNLNDCLKGCSAFWFLC